MTRPFRSLTLAALAAAAFASSPAAFAQAQASLLTDASDYQLVDLNPTDGREPGIGFYNNWSTIQASYYGSPDGSGTPIDSVSHSYAYGPSTLSIVHDGTYIYNSGSAGNANAIVSIARGSAYLDADAYNSFVLAPYTQVTFSLAANIGILHDVGNLSSASITMTGHKQAADGAVFEDTSTLSGSDQGVADTIYVTLRSGADDLYGWVEYRSALSAQVLAVPEPATAPMFAAGVVLIGALARRRHARSRRGYRYTSGTIRLAGTGRRT